MTYLAHYGVSKRDGAPIGSGRYPLGSGEDPNQRPEFLTDVVNRMKREGIPETEIAKQLGFESAGKMRDRQTSSSADKKKWQAQTAAKLKYDRQWSEKAIADYLGVTTKTVRKYLDPVESEKIQKSTALRDMLRDQVNEKGVIDVGTGVERQIGVQAAKLKAACTDLEEEGYRVWKVPVEQLGTGKDTYIKVLAKPDYSWGNIKRDPTLIQPVTEYTNDNGRVYTKIEKPTDISSSRVMVKYAEDGGTDRDGVIELRPGVPDISLGKSTYAQVRISVDGTHYLKGMAVYSNDLPDGIDIRFNTNKHKGTPMMGEDKHNTVLKLQKDDESNPFGATIRQRKYIGEDGKEHLSAINIVNDEGNWSENWSKSLSSQFLSKQTPELARKQLSQTLLEMQSDFDDIKSMTNPACKKYFLDEFADQCDSAAVHLKAAAMPRQGWHVLLPCPDIPENKIYAPNYKDGEQVVLVRYPHEGRFQIAELTVSSRGEMKKARELVGNNPTDAVVIHPKVAAKLSGADFDGDTVIVIPNNDGAIKTKGILKGLEDYDPKERYKAYEGMPEVGKQDKFDTQKQMGRVSNLITDMTLKGATEDELARAVRHSMCIIDAEKHNLNWRASEEENGIKELKAKYQGGANRGASTIISRASAREDVPQRNIGAYYVDPVTGKKSKTKLKADPNTGEKLYEYTGKVYHRPIIDKKTGELLGWKDVPKTQRSTKMAERKDARELSSGYEIEEVYAAHANALKQLAREARMESIRTEPKPRDPQVTKQYEAEVTELKAQLNMAKKNAPIERQAQILAGAMFKAAKEDNPAMDTDDIKKCRDQKLTQARAITGAGKRRIKITEKQWEAMEKGALSTTQQLEIFSNSDKEYLKRLARPKDRKSLSNSQLALAKRLLANEVPQSEVAERLGVSTSTLMNLINGGSE